MVICISQSGHVAIVTQRTKRATTYITTIKKKRKLVVDRNVDFDRDFQLYANDPVKAALNWLSSPLTMTQEVRKRLQMIVEMKGNKVVAKHDDESTVPTGATYLQGPEDMNGYSVKALTALYNKISGGEPVKQFSSIEEATTKVWEAMESYEPPVKEKKEKKEKVAKEKIELIELPKKIGKSSIITVVSEGNPRREGTTGHANFSNYVSGETVAEFLAKEGALTGHLRWDAERGFITLEFVEEVAPEKEEVEKPIKEKKAKKAKKTGE